MNEAGREKLVAAALKGVKQVHDGNYHNGEGMCALGVLGVSITGANEEKICARYEISYGSDRIPCPICGTKTEQFSERELIVHYNDYHKFDFLTIARKV